MTSYMSGTMRLISYNELENGSVFHLNSGTDNPTAFIKIYEDVCCYVVYQPEEIYIDRDPLWRSLGSIGVIFVTLLPNKLLIALHNAFPPSEI